MNKVWGKWMNKVWGKGGNQWPELTLVVAMMKTMTVARNNVNDGSGGDTTETLQTATD